MSTDTHEAFLRELALLPLVDTETLEGLYAVLEDELFPILDEFISSLPDLLQAVSQGMDTPEWPVVQRNVHSIKGSAGNVGAARLSRYASEMERLSFAQSREALVSLWPGFQALSTETLTALSAFVDARRH
jgi:HPt (histidine-containing phosphotransfer) domain-containing protein